MFVTRKRYERETAKLYKQVALNKGMIEDLIHHTVEDLSKLEWRTDDLEHRIIEVLEKQMEESRTKIDDLQRIQMRKHDELALRVARLEQRIGKEQGGEAE